MIASDGYSSISDAESESCFIMFFHFSRDGKIVFGEVPTHRMTESCFPIRAFRNVWHVQEPIRTNPIWGYLDITSVSIWNKNCVILMRIIQLLKILTLQWLNQGTIHANRRRRKGDIDTDSKKIYNNLNGCHRFFVQSSCRFSDRNINSIFSQLEWGWKIVHRNCYIAIFLLSGIRRNTRRNGTAAFCQAGEGWWKIHLKIGNSKTRCFCWQPSPPSSI